MHDIIKILVDADHFLRCPVDTIARDGEGDVIQLEITFPEKLSTWWAYLDFKMSNGEKFKSPRLDVEGNKATYIVPPYVLREGKLKVQVLFQNESGATWKSYKKPFTVRPSINAVEDIPEKEDFIAEAQKLLDEIKKEDYGTLKTYYTENYAFAVGDAKGNVVAAVKNNGETVGNFPDQTARRKLKPIASTDDYAYAVCDEDGNVVFAITHDGEVLPEQTGGGTTVVTGGTALDYTKCGLPVLYLTGDTTEMTKDNAVVLDCRLTTPKGATGVASTTIFTGTCTCKWQGSSSVDNNYQKRNYTIKFDTAFDATRAVGVRNGEEIIIDAWGAQKKYCLKANWIDPSCARNVVNAKLWGEIVDSRASSSVVSSVTDLRATAPNGGAIDGFPCIIAINGEFVGLYTFNIPKDGWMFGMGESNKEYVVGGESNYKSESGFYATPTFVEDANGNVDFSIEYQPDGVDDATVISSFQTAVNAVKNAPNSAEWETAVANYFDIGSAIDYYIFTCCISAHDNLRRNTLYGTYDGKKWFMSAYDLDTTLGSNAYGTGMYPVKTQRTQFYEAANGGQKHRLFELIYKYSTAKLVARYDELRSTVLSDENVWYRLNNFVNAIPRVVYNADAEKWHDKWDKYQYPMPATTTANVENYMQYYRMHCAYLDKEIEALREKEV